MNICIGIVGGGDGWQTLLEQEGVPHAVVQGDLTPDSFSAVVANDAVDDRDIAMLRQYLELGGAMLCSAKAYAAIRKTTRQRKPIQYVLPGPGSIFGDVGLVDLQGETYIAWNANELPAQDGSPSAFVGTLDGGHIIALPFDPSSLVRSTEAARRSFYSATSRLPFERVSSVNKNGVRRIVTRSLEYLHAVRGLPYVHLWYYPSAGSSVFGLRIDTDGGTAGHIEHLYEFFRSRRVHASWYVDVKTQEEFLWRYKQMQGHEIGIHCYEHKTYPDESRNHENILKARHIFRDAQMGSDGFVAPFGKWNENLGKVIREFRFEYSSEFAWDYDNFPSEPWLDEHERGVLQLPVHPISVGSLRRQGLTPAEMKAYFRNVFEEKLTRREPLMFYHHPKDANEEVVGSLIDMAETQRIPTMTLGEWARWWKARMTAIPSVRLKDETLIVEGGSMQDGRTMRVQRGDGQEAFISTDQKARLDGLEWTRPPVPSEVAPDLARVRAFNVRIPVTLAVDAVTSIRLKK